MKTLSERINFELVVLLIGKVLHISISLLSIRLMTTYLDETEVGKYYLILTVLTLLNFSLLNAPGQYYNRRLIELYSSGKLGSGTRLLLIYRSILVLFCILLGFIVYEVSSLDDMFGIGEYNALLLLSLIGGTTLVLANAINILGNRLSFVAINTLYLVLGLVLAFILVEYYKPTAAYWYFGISLGQVVLILPALYLIFSIDKKRIRFKN